MRKRWRIRKARREQEIIARGLLELHYLAVTAHGRWQLRTICSNAEYNGVDPIILGMYQFFLNHAPVSDHAETN